MDSIDLNSIIIALSSGVGMTVVTFLTTKRKYKAESASIETQNMQTILSAYKVELEAMKDRISEYTNKVSYLEGRIDELIAENRSLKNKTNITAKSSK